MHTIPEHILARHDYKIPHYLAGSLRHVDFETLHERGIRHLVLDIDNTLVSFGQRDIHTHIGLFLQELRSRGELESFSLATNSRRNISHIIEALQPDHVFQPQGLAVKPFPAYFHRVIAGIGAPPPSVVMIGDKLVQDVWGARRAGMITVLVKPLGRDLWLDTLLAIRWRERRRLRSYLPHHPEHWF